MLTRFISGFIVVVLSLGLGACAGNEFPTDVVRDYFSAIAGIQPPKILSAKEFAVPNSDAEAYAIEQSAFAQSSLDGGSLDTTLKQEAVVDGQKAYICPGGLKIQSSERPDYCYTYSNFKFKNGLISTFDAGKEPLKGRIALGTGEATPIGDIASATYISSYVSIDGELIIILEIKSNIDELQIPYNAQYLPPSGRQVELTTQQGSNQLDAGRVGNVSFVFSGAEFGGNLELTFTDSEWNEVPVSIPTTK